MSVIVHPSSVVSPKAELEDGVRIGPFCVIADKVKIGAGTSSAFMITSQSAATAKSASTQQSEEIHRITDSRVKSRMSESGTII